MTPTIRRGARVVMAATLLALMTTTLCAQSARPESRAAARPQLLDSIVAVVGNETVTHRELALEIRQKIQSIKQKKGDLPDRETLIRQVLEQLIMLKLQLLEAENRGITIDELALDRLMEGIAAQNKLTLDQLREKAEEGGLSYADLREQVRTKNIIQRLIQESVIDRVEVSEKEIDDILSERGQDALIKYHFAHISAPGQAHKLEQIRQLFKKKPQRSFKALRAKLKHEQKKAQDKTSYQIRDFGWRPTSKLPEDLRKQLTDMAVGSFSSVIQKTDEAHLFVLLGIRNSMPDEARTVYRVRHILMQPDVISDSDAIAEKLSRMRHDIISGKKRFGDLARRYSKDYGSSIKGGLLPWSSSRKWVPEFAEAALSAPLGKIVGPFSTNYGWHLLQVLEKKEIAASMDDIRNKIEAEIRKNKANDEIRQWLINLRNNRYVDILLDKKPEPRT